jgi:hypothetical protein
MMQQFPIFVDLHVVPPLIIGDAPALAAKLRLLRKAAPLVDVIASKNAQWRSEFATDTGVCWLAEMDRLFAAVRLYPCRDQTGRPLALATGASGDPPSFPAYAGQPAVAARLTSPAAGSSAAIAMARFFCKFFHEFFGSSLDKLSAKSQLACMVFWHSQAMSARRC